MEPLPKSPIIHHFTHPGHDLEELNAITEYGCDGCKTGGGAGKRYRCRHGCDFDLHEYCGTCPEKLSTFMHSHQLSLLMRRPRHDCQNDSTLCDVCCDNVEGLFYRCNACDFDVHPLCTQLPESLAHDLHKDHPLKLDSSSVKGKCAVCSENCSSWRYRCEPCGFDLHLDCILIGFEQKESQESPRGTPKFVPPLPPHHHLPPPQPFHPAYPPFPHGGYYYPYYPFPPSNFYHHNAVAQPNNDQRGGGTSRRAKGLGWKMFSLVGELGVNVISNVIGADISSFIDI